MSARRGYRYLAAAVALTSAVALASACSSDKSAAKGGAAAVNVSPDSQYLAKYGWTPMDNSLQNMACTDNSYANAIKNGIKLGIYSAQPYEYIDKNTNQPAGLDWDINMAVLKYIGVTKYTTVNLQWDGMIPALNSGRIDVITGNIHQTAARLKNMGFTSPAWWYGSSMMVKKGNPAHIASWKDLSGKDIKVGVVNGSQSQEYLRSIQANAIPYEDANSEFTSLVGGREDVIVDDTPKEAAFLQANPSADLEILHTSDIPPQELLANYARYGVRKSDCTLNAAYSRGLEELRAHGVIGKILAQYGLTDNQFEPQYKPE